MGKAQATMAADWHRQVAALNQTAPADAGSITDRLLMRMDPAIARSFSEVQLCALEHALTAAPAKRPPVDIRLTAPFFSRRYFITVLAGPERRSRQRLQEDRASHSVWTVANSCLFVFLLLLFVPTLIGLLHMLVEMG